MELWYDAMFHGERKESFYHTLLNSHVNSIPMQVLHISKHQKGGGGTKIYVL